MKKIDTYIYKLGLWAGAALSLTACVDEDLSDCPPNVEMREITVSYQIDLQHGVDPEFEAELLSLHLGFWNSPQNLYRDLVFQPEDMPEELFLQGDAPCGQLRPLGRGQPQQRPRGRRSAHVRQRVGRRGGGRNAHFPGHHQGFGLSAFLRRAEHADGGRRDRPLYRIDEPGGGQGETSREPPER